MQKRNVGPFAVSPIGLGCMNLSHAYGVPPEEKEAIALQHNAAACTMAHNHPSGVAEPCAADRATAKEPGDGLRHVGMRVLDHLVVSAAECVSMAARGLL